MIAFFMIKVALVGEDDTRNGVHFVCCCVAEEYTSLKETGWLEAWDDDLVYVPLAA